MKVYGWQGYRTECKTNSRQTREIVCAKSAAAAARAAGKKRPSALFNFCVTGNHDEVRLASAHPGVVFWAPLDQALLSSRKGFKRAGSEEPEPEPRSAEYWELHVTLNEPPSNLVRVHVEHERWTFSNITDDPIIGKGPKCYATKHLNVRVYTHQMAVQVVEEKAAQLVELGLKVVRAKVERVVYDRVVK